MNNRTDITLTVTVAQGLALSASDRCIALRLRGESAASMRDRAARRRADARWLDTSCLALVTEILGGAA